MLYILLCGVPPFWAGLYLFIYLFFNVLCHFLLWLIFDKSII